MSADLHLDPDGLRRVARNARRIADGLDVAAAPLPSAVGPGVERAQDDLRAAVHRVREELAGLAEGAATAAARAEETDRQVADGMRRHTEPPSDPVGGRRSVVVPETDRPGST